MINMNIKKVMDDVHTLFFNNKEKGMNDVMNNEILVETILLLRNEILNRKCIIILLAKTNISIRK